MTSVGVDLIEIERIRNALERYPSFRDRCFTEAERAYCDSRPNPPQHYAARFAGKEAVGKALGFGVARAFAWRDVEIAGRPKPSVALSGRIERLGRAGGRGVDRPLDVALARPGGGGLRRRRRCLSRSTPRTRCAPPRRRTRASRRPLPELMERAGKAVADLVLAEFADARRGSRSSAAPATTAATAGSPPATSSGPGATCSSST